MNVAAEPVVCPTCGRAVKSLADLAWMLLYAGGAMSPRKLARALYPGVEIDVAKQRASSLLDYLRKLGRVERVGAASWKAVVPKGAA